MECILDDIKVHYEIRGKGRPILMLHGWPADHFQMMMAFEPIFEDLEGWRRVYLDLPGMGKTAGVKRIKTHDDMLEVVLDFIDNVIMNEHFHIVGLSYGAYLARGIIYKRGASVDGLMMYVPMMFANWKKRTLPEHIILFENPDFYEELKANNLQELIEFVTDQNEGCLENLLTVGIQAKTTADFEFLDAIDFEKGFSFCRDDEVLYFSKPTLIVVGRQDSVVGYRDAWQLIGGFPRATFAALDYSGHALGVGERNTIFRALVYDWIDRLEKDAQH